MVKKPGLLFVSYYFPPTKSIACIRNYNICAEFNLRYDVHVLTTNNTSRFTHDQYPHLDIVSKVHLWTIDIRTLINRKPLKSTIKKGNTSSFIYSLLNSFPYNILLGIGGLIYILHGLIVGLRSIKKK